VSCTLSLIQNKKYFDCIVWSHILAELITNMISHMLLHHGISTSRAGNNGLRGSLRLRCRQLSNVTGVQVNFAVRTSHWHARLRIAASRTRTRLAFRRKDRDLDLGPQLFVRVTVPCVLAPDLNGGSPSKRPRHEVHI
jgi:hypothetical protein